MKTRSEREVVADFVRSIRPTYDACLLGCAATTKRGPPRTEKGPRLLHGACRGAKPLCTFFCPKIGGPRGLNT